MGISGPPPPSFYCKHFRRVSLESSGNFSRFGISLAYIQRGSGACGLEQGRLCTALEKSFITCAQEKAMGKTCLFSLKSGYPESSPDIRAAASALISFPYFA